MFNKYFRSLASDKFWNMRKIVTILFIFFQFENAWSQNDSLQMSEVYKMKYKIEIPVTLGLFAANYMGFDLIKNKTHLISDKIHSLDPKNIWSLDRPAVEQDYSFNSVENAVKASDLGMNISLFLPVFLYLDKNIRKDGLDILLLYLETQGINTALYTYAAALPTNRIRPFVYYPEVSLEKKLGHGTLDSFFSGHTSSTATASFFLAKVYNDYHPELKWKKWIVYSAALIPPTFVGYYRYKALMHFPTDILLGITVGIASGIFIPNLHKLKFGKKQNLSIIPLTGNVFGFSAKLKFS